MKNGYHLGKNRPKVNHLLYMDDLKLYAKDKKELDALIQTVRVFSKDIGMDFGIEKCAMIQMKRGKFVMSEGIELPNGKKTSCRMCREREETMAHIVFECQKLAPREYKS